MKQLTVEIMVDSIRVFRDILSSDRNQSVAVFDLDSTIFNVSFRTKRIFEEFANLPHIQTHFPSEAQALSQVQVHHTDWGLRESLERHSLYAPETFYKSLHEFWKESFFSNHYLHVDRPYQGAIEYVQALAQSQVNIRYLTGRDEKNMYEGTIKSLNQWGLPLNDKTHLIMKPTKGFLIDEEFKRTEILKIRSAVPNIWFFENEPAIIQAVEKSSPEVRIIWINTTHSRRAPNPTHLPTIPHEWHFG